MVFVLVHLNNTTINQEVYSVPRRWAMLLSNELIPRTLDLDMARHLVLLHCLCSGNEWCHHYQASFDARTAVTELSRAMTWFHHKPPHAATREVPQSSTRYTSSSFTCQHVKQLCQRGQLKRGRVDRRKSKLKQQPTRIASKNNKHISQTSESS